jgi:type IV pilus assembly protein PilM
LVDGQPHTIKEEPIGGQRLTDEIEDTFGLPPEEAEAVKLGSIEPPNRHDCAEIFDRLVSNWQAAIERALEMVKGEYQDYRPSRILLAGGGALVNGLAENFQGYFHVPTELFNPLTSVKFNPKKFDPGYIDYIGPQMAVCFGLALRKAETV